jgi:hypothetical protein
VASQRRAFLSDSGGRLRVFRPRYLCGDDRSDAAVVHAPWVSRVRISATTTPFNKKDRWPEAHEGRNRTHLAFNPLMASKLTDARSAVVRALEDPSITSRTAGALRGVLRLIDTVSAHGRFALHEEALRVAYEALEHARIARKSGH